MTNIQTSNPEPTPTPAPATPPTEIPVPQPSDTSSAKNPPRDSVEKPAQKKWVLPVIIILSLLTLAGLGTSIYFGIQSSNQAAEISDLKSQLDHQQPSQEPQDPSSTPTEPTTPSDEDISEILAQVPKNLVIKSNDIAYSIGVSHRDYDMYAMSYRWSFYDNNGVITIYWDTLAENLNPNHKTGTEEVAAFGPAGGNVIDVVFGRFGNGSGDETILFLMDDGTIEYVPYYLALKENNFRSRGKLEGINGVIRLLYVNANNPNGTGGYRTVLAQRADGTLYDLSSTITNLNLPASY